MQGKGEIKEHVAHVAEGTKIETKVGPYYVDLNAAYSTEEIHALNFQTAADPYDGMHGWQLSAFEIDDIPPYCEPRSFLGLKEYRENRFQITFNHLHRFRFVFNTRQGADDWLARYLTYFVPKIAQRRLDKIVEAYRELSAVPPLPAEPEPTVPEIDERHWYSHSLLLARTQMGKTNVIQWRIKNLWPQIAAGKASLILMEPKGVLTRDIINMAHTWDIRDRVIILDPADTPVSVNIFDRGDGTDQALNETVARVSRVIGTLSTDFTGFQRDAITFAVRAMFALPDRTELGTLARILRGGKTVLPLDSLPRSVREYFEFDFKEADGRYIVSRLNSLLANPVFEALFAGERTTFDILSEIQAGKLIVINTSSRALGGDSHLYGRFWIEEVQRCVWPRLEMPREKRTPTMFILDEAQTWIAEDLHIAQLLDQAAEARIGMMFGMHHLTQLTEQRVKDSILTNTALKFVANTSAGIADLARAMGNTDTDFLTGLPLYEFAYYGPGMSAPIKVKFPLVDFGKEPKMSTEQYRDLRVANSKRYADGEPPPPPAPPEPEENRDRVSIDDLSLADAYAQMALAIRRGNTARAAELQGHINSFRQRASSGSTADVETENKPGEGATDWR
jgi:hypothetical protein